MDLQVFFDRVNHDRLMVRLKSRCHDHDLLRLINRYLKAGVRVGEHTEATTMGVPQGGPLKEKFAVASKLPQRPRFMGTSKNSNL